MGGTNYPMEGRDVVFVALAFLWLAFGVLGAWIAGQKSREPIEGLALGFLFGPLGVLIEALLPNGDSRSAAVEITDDGDEDGPPPAWLSKPGGIELPREPSRPKRKADEPPPEIKQLRL